MANRADGLIAAMMSNRWMTTSAPAAGATVTANVAAPQNAKSQLYCDWISYTINNLNTGAGFTVTVAVRDVSFAGTVLASWKHLVAGSTGVAVSIANISIPATKGAGLHFTMDTVLASVVCTMNAGGWEDETQGS